MPKKTEAPVRPGLTPGLVLTRRVGDIIFIELPEELGGQRVQVSLVSIEGSGAAKLGIRTPRDWNVARGEVSGDYLSEESIVKHQRKR